MSTLIGLEREISNRVMLLADLVGQSGLKDPTWDEDSPAVFQIGGSQIEEITQARSSLMDSLLDMMRLVLGPTEVLRSLISAAPLDCGTMRVIVNHNVADKVPFGHGKSFADLAHDVKLDVAMLTRILRYCMTNGVFREEPLGSVRHTAASAALKRAGLSDALKWSVEIPAFSAFRISDALRKFGSCNTAKTTPFNLAYDTQQTMWEYHECHPEMQHLFSINMAHDGQDSHQAPEHILTAFDWSKLGRGSVVDIGGSSGYVSMVIAEAYPDLHFVVQDLEDMIPRGKIELSPRLRGRIEYQTYDFFTPQLVEADVYMYRYVFHNWSDEESIRIIQALNPALRSGARLMIVEMVEGMNEIGQFAKKHYRYRDVQMMALLGGKERSVHDFVTLVATAESHFTFVSYKKPLGSSLTLMEWIYDFGEVVLEDGCKAIKGV